VRLTAVLETVLYYNAAEEDEVERFYRYVLGLRRVSRFDDGMVFRLGEGLLLLFDAGKTSARPNERSRHGAVGATHTCFLAATGEYERWKEVLAAAGATIDEEIAWKSGIRSFYFRDPAGNLLEIAERDLWPG
jgi:catechol 2,3-dioxygenase-like lactoylglutathione lyase family enzyme